MTQTKKATVSRTIICLIVMLFLVSCATSNQLNITKTPEQKLTEAKMVIKETNLFVANLLNNGVIEVKDATAYRDGITAARMLVRSYEINMKLKDFTDEEALWKVIDDVLLKLEQYKEDN